jgi:hypothetical protein
MGDAGPEKDAAGLLGSSATVVRLIFGWAGAAIGALDLGMGAGDRRYLLFHGLLLIAGLLLLSLDRLFHARRPGRLAGLVAGGCALIGVVVSTLPGSSTACCMRDLPIRHGFPFALLGREGARWQVSPGHAIADLLFWACAGLVVLVLVTLLRPAREAPREDLSRTQPTHAEDRSARHVRAAESEDVRGLP